MKKVCIVIIATFISLSVLPVQGQDLQAVSDTTAVWQIITNDENEFIGTIISETDGTVKLQTETYGVIELDRATIFKMVRMNDDRLVGDQYWPEHLQSTRYFWAPSGYALKEGEGYYQNVWIFFNQFSTAVTEKFSIGIGTIPVILMGGDALPIWVTPKFSIPLVENRLNLAAGGLVGGVIGEEDSFFGIAYTNLTIGRKDKNISLGLGYGFTGDGWDDTPVFSVSAISRVSKKGYFLMENYLYTGGDDYVVTVLLGGRTVWHRASLDYGALMPFTEGMDSFVAIPWLSLIIPFTSKK